MTEAFHASAFVERTFAEEYGSQRIEKIDGTEKMITPGLVNGHTHSVEHWLRGAIPPLPLEMWLFQLVFNEPRGAPGGWFKEKSWMETPAAMVAISALLCGIETLMSGSTVVMDHLFVRHIEDVEAAVTAYKALGIRCFIAPMLDDEATFKHNYCPLARDAKERLAFCKGCGCCGGLDPKTGCFRTEKKCVGSEEEGGDVAVVGGSGAEISRPRERSEYLYRSSDVFRRNFRDVERRGGFAEKIRVVGHIHLLETRTQALQSKQFLNENGCEGSSVKLLEKTDS